MKEIEVVSVGTGASYLFPCHQWISRDKGDSIVEHVLDSNEIRIGVVLDNPEKPDGIPPVTIKTASIRLSAGNLPDSVFGSEFCCVLSVLADPDELVESWNEITRTATLNGKKEIFWPALPALQFEPPTGLLPLGSRSLLNVILMQNNNVFGSVKVSLEDIFSHASLRTGLCLVNCTDDNGAGVTTLDSRILHNLQPNLFFIGTRSTAIVPKVVTFLNLRMMVANLPPRICGAEIFASVFALTDSDNLGRQISRTASCNDNKEPFWNALPFQVDPPNRLFPLGLNTTVRVVIIEKSAEYGEQIFGSVTFQLQKALNLAPNRRGILLESDGVLDPNVLKLLEPKIFFFGTHKSFATFDPAIHSVVEPPRSALVPHPPSEPRSDSTTSMRKLSRARIIRDFEQRLIHKDTAKSFEEDARRLALATACISRLVSKFMREARKKGGPGVTILSYFKSKKSLAAVTVQSNWKAHTARAACSIELQARRVQRLVQNSACVQVQCVYRGHQARQAVEKLKLLNRSLRISLMVVKVQARLRGILGRYRAAKARHELYHRLKLQMYVRRWLLNKRIQSRRRNNAASRIQQHVLGSLGASDALRYSIAQRQFVRQGLFIILWVVILGFLSFLTMKSSVPLRPWNVKGSSVLASVSNTAAPLRSYLMLESFVSNILPYLTDSRRNSSISVTGSPNWEVRVGGNYNRMFLPTTSPFVPIDAVTLRLRRRLHVSEIFMSDELISVVANVSKYIYTSSIDHSDMRELGLFCPWSEAAGPTVGCSTCSAYLPPDGNLYSFKLESNPIALDLLQAQGWDFSGATSVALDIPFLSVLSPALSIMTISVQMPDNSDGSGLSFLTTSWQTRFIPANSWFVPSPYPAAIAIAGLLGLCVFVHVCDIFLGPKEWLLRRSLSMYASNVIY